MKNAEDLFPIVFSVLFAGYGIYQLRTGVAHTRTMKFKRKQHPKFFWFSVTSSFGIAALILFVALERYFRVA